MGAQGAQPPFSAVSGPGRYYCTSNGACRKKDSSSCSGTSSRRRRNNPADVYNDADRCDLSKHECITPPC